MILTDLTNTDERYDLILADPPWQQKRGQGNKTARPATAGKPLDYATLTLPEIAEHLLWASRLLPYEGGVLFLWTIEKYLIQAQQMAELLGFKLHARMIWDKVTGIPAAYTVRFGHEYLLYMYRGKLPPIAKEEQGKIHTVFHEIPKRHSQKPEVSYEIIERLYPDARKLELYARRERPGWDCWGNEV